MSSEHGLRVRKMWVKQFEQEMEKERKQLQARADALKATLVDKYGLPEDELCAQVDPALNDVVLWRDESVLFHPDGNYKDLPRMMGYAPDGNGGIEPMGWGGSIVHGAVDIGRALVTYDHWFEEGAVQTDEGVKDVDLGAQTGMDPDQVSALADLVLDILCQRLTLTPEPGVTDTEDLVPASW